MWNRQSLIQDAQLVRLSIVKHIVFVLTSCSSWVTTSAFPIDYGVDAPQLNKAHLQVSGHKPLPHRFPIWSRHTNEKKSVLKHLEEPKTPTPFSDDESGSWTTRSILTDYLVLVSPLVSMPYHPELHTYPKPYHFLEPLRHSQPQKTLDP